MPKRLLVLCAALVVLAVFSPRDARAWVDDYPITISTAADIKAKRARLIKFVWGKDGFPSASSELVSGDIPSPVTGLDNLERVEKLRTTLPTLTMGPVIVPAYHFIPVQKNGRLVVVQQGHG